MTLVTGGTGLVGAYLLLRLAERDVPLRALYRNAASISNAKNIFEFHNKSALFDRVEWMQADITDIPALEDTFKDIIYVYHCAALISFDPRDQDKLRKVNIEGTANVVNCALSFGVKKLCFVSSIAALGDLKEGEFLITEETEWNPEKAHSDYAISKHGAEMEVWRGWQEGLDVVIINPGVIFGYGFWQQGSGKIVESIRRGQRFYTDGICALVAVEDVTAILVKLMESAISGQRYTAVAQNMPIENIFKSLATGMGKPAPPTLATSLLTSLAWRLDWLLNILAARPRSFTRVMARASHSTVKYDNSKIRREGYAFKEMESYLKELGASFSRRFQQ